MATTKKSTAKKRKPAAKKPTKAQLQAKRELNAIILFALGVLLLLLAAIPGDNAWNTVHNVLRGLMGWCCYLMGPLMMIVAVLLMILGVTIVITSGKELIRKKSADHA